MNDFEKEQEKYERFRKMSPEEMQQIMAATVKEAEKMMAKLTPEQRKKAEEEAKRMLEEETRKREALMAQVREIQNGAEKDQKSRPRFCGNCGAPVTDGNFCGNCGAPIIR